MAASSHRTRDRQPQDRLPADQVWEQFGRTIEAGPLDGILTTALEQMAQAWHSGHVASAEHWLAKHPELSADPEIAVRIIYEEVCLREEDGEQVESTELYRRFPQWREALAVVLDCHRLMPDLKQHAQFPVAGQTLGEFRLLHELGRGALGRVFLATQPSLSDRPLVVKLTAQSGQEHLSLARLQHTNIVPLYLVQDFPAEHLRALCMPYLGGATWSAVLQGQESHPPAQRSGEQIVARLSQLQRHSSHSQAAVGPAVSFLARSTYVEAVCWIGACLADALHYAHQCGLVHLDIKPSNVLLAGDGQPMLLDFHLACELRRLQDNTFDRLGGTPDYMSPEQSAATEAFKSGQPMPQIDGRSDIYSLGVLLYESLAGQLPSADPLAIRRTLRKANPCVSQGLAQIVGKCLASSSSARYHDAGQLATDLRCHLANMPLRGVANRSFAERWQKWRRRKPQALPILLAAMASTVMIFGIGGLFYRDRIRTAESLLMQSQREFGHGDYEMSKQHAQTACGSLHWFPWTVDLKSRLQEQIDTAQRAKFVAQLHNLVEQLRFLDDQQLSDRKRAEVFQLCQQVWQVREAIVGHDNDSDDNSRSSSLTEQLRHDLLDLAILSARLNVHLATSDNFAAAQRSAVEELDQARELCGASPILELVRRDYSSDANANTLDVEAKSLPTANNAWEHYALGRWLKHHGLLADAQRHFAAAIELQPDDFWANFQSTRCNYELSQFEQALTSATVCVALAPRRAECYFNRALCYQSLGRNAEALADFSRALQLDPNLAPAALAKGTLLLKLQQFDEAAASFQLALAHGSRPSDVDYQFARLSVAQHNTSSARQWIDKSLAEDPANSAAQLLQKELSATAP